MAPGAEGLAGHDRTWAGHLHRGSRARHTRGAADLRGQLPGPSRGRWLFLTGPEDKLYPLIRKSFLSAVEQNRGTAQDPGSEVTHSTRLFVVDRRGHIRGMFDGRAVDEAGQRVDDVPRVSQKVTELEREGP